MILTIGIAFLPAPWRLGWSKDVAGVAQVPLRPFTHLGTALAGWLRPPSAPSDGVPDEARELVDQLTEDRDLAHRRYLVERERVRELEQVIADLQGLPPAARSSERIIRIAHVSRRPLEAAQGPVEVTLPRDAAGVLGLDAIAVHRGVHLVGRLVGDPSGSVLTVLPITSTATGYVTVRIGERDGTLPPDDDARRVQLNPTGEGTLDGMIDREVPLQGGEWVFLDDESWLACARFMRLGRVTKIEPHHEEPLLNHIEVTPTYLVTELAQVTLVADPLTGGAP